MSLQIIRQDITKMCVNDGVDLAVHEGAGPLLVAEGELKREGNGKNTTYYRLK